MTWIHRIRTNLQVRHPKASSTRTFTPPMAVWSSPNCISSGCILFWNMAITTPVLPSRKGHFWDKGRQLSRQELWGAFCVSVVFPNGFHAGRWLPTLERIYLRTWASILQVCRSIGVFLAPLCCNGKENTGEIASWYREMAFPYREIQDTSG